MTETTEKDTAIPVPRDEDDIRQYLREIRQIPRLTPEEERELARRCAQGDEEAIRKMVNANLRLVVSVAKEYSGRGVPLMDLIQEGSIGLLAAARKFDYTRDLRFSTYATKWIRQGVTRCLLNHAGAIRVPVHTAERMRKVQAAQAVLRQEQGTEPTAEEIAARVDMPREKVAQLLQLSPDVCSLDVPVGDEDKSSFGNLLEDLEAPQPQEELVRKELNDAIDRLLSNLTQRQRTILRLHFGMEDGVCHSLEEIGQKLGVDKSTVSRTIKRGEHRLQRCLRYGAKGLLES